MAFCDYHRAYNLSLDPQRKKSIAKNFDMEILFYMVCLHKSSSPNEKEHAYSVSFAIDLIGKIFRQKPFLFIQMVLAMFVDYGKLVSLDIDHRGTAHFHPASVQDV